MHHLAGTGHGLVAFVDVGQHRQAEGLAHLLQDRQALLWAGDRAEAHGVGQLC